MSCSTNWPPGWTVDLLCPYKPLWRCGFSAVGPAALLRYGGMGWGPQQPLSSWPWGSTSSHGTWMWGSEVPLASVATNQSTSDGWSGQGGSRQGQISSIASHEAGLYEGSPGGSFLLQVNTAWWSQALLTTSSCTAILHGGMCPVTFRCMRRFIPVPWASCLSGQDPSSVPSLLRPWHLPGGIGSLSEVHGVGESLIPGEQVHSTLACDNSCERWLLYVLGFYICAWRDLDEKTVVCKPSIYTCCKTLLVHHCFHLPLCSLWSPVTQMLYLELILAESCCSSTTEPLPQHPLRRTIRTLSKWATSISLQLPAEQEWDRKTLQLCAVRIAALQRVCKCSLCAGTLLVAKQVGMLG